jgi:hypothetical protein
VEPCRSAAAQGKAPSSAPWSPPYVIRPRTDGYSAEYQTGPTADSPCPLIAESHP